MRREVQAILDYVEAPRTDYAMLINGPWGCGKTHLWKNEATMQLGNVNGYRLLYASFYGCRDTSDVGTQLFFSSHRVQHTDRKRSILKFFGNLWESRAGIPVPAVDLRWLTGLENAVLCFDDLERSVIPMREALGYINSFAERDRAKVVVLCNEERIEEKQQSDYSDMKEKVFGVTLDLQPDEKLVLNALMREYTCDDFHQAMSRHSPAIRSFLAKSGTHNFRSMRRALASLYTVLGAIDSTTVDLLSVSETLVKLVIPASLELNRPGVSPEAIRDILSSSNIVLSGWASRTNRKNGGEPEPYIVTFVERYFPETSTPDWKNASGCPAIGDYLTTGVLNRKALQEWALQLTASPDERDARITRLGQDYRRMSDEEFANAAKLTLADVETGVFTEPGHYLGLFNLFETFSTLGLIQVTDDALLRKFLVGVEAARGRGLVPQLRLKEEVARFVSTSPEGQQLKDAVLQANDHSLRQKQRERVEHFTSRLGSAAEEFIQALSDGKEGGLMGLPVFQEMAEELPNWIRKLPNELKVSLRYSLEIRYNLPPQMLQVYSIELDSLRQASALLKSERDGRGDGPLRPSQLAVDELVELLESIAGLLKEPSAPSQRGGPSMGTNAEGEP